MSYIGVQMARSRGVPFDDPRGDGIERAVTTRPPSTALLAVDSLDREQFPGSGTSANFTINKNQSLFNGFFSRVALNEIVLDWCIPNIGVETENNTFAIQLSPGPGSYSVVLPTGHYTVADVLDSIIIGLNTLAGAGTFRLEDSYGNAWVTGTSIGNVYIATTAGGNFTINNTALATQLNVAVGTVGNAFPVSCPKLLPYYYIDFVSPQLTYNQDLKDNSTSSVVRDVLYRWVFAHDNVPQALDRYNYPILQGYKEFVTRRYLSFPKQILWNPSMPVGQISFQIYTSNGDLLDPTALDGECEFQMSLLFSEN